MEMKPSKTHWLSLDLIDKNPYRDLINNPVTKARSDVLIESINSTGYWEGQLVRPSPTAPGRYEIPFGHSRIEAARFCNVKEAEFIVRDLDDNTMLRMMVDENMSRSEGGGYPAIREAIFAATDRILGLIVADRPPPEFGRGVESEKQLSSMVESVKNGGAPGRETIRGFFRGTLSKNNIEVALQDYNITGALQDWHIGNNPNYKKPKISPLVDAEAMRRFNRSYHARMFLDAVVRHKISYSSQVGLADTLIEDILIKDLKSGDAVAKRVDKLAEKLNEVPPLQEEIKEKQKVTIELALGEMRIALGKAVLATDKLNKAALGIGKTELNFNSDSHAKAILENYKLIDVNVKSAIRRGLKINW